jgi:hypothetical protein
MTDNVESITLPVLVKIQETLVEMRDEMREMRGEMHGLRGAVDGTNLRIDNLIDVVGGKTRGHDERIDALEKRVTLLERGRSRRRPTNPRR